MARENPRAELIRKVEKRMKRRNRKVALFVFILAFVLGFACAIWLIWSNALPALNEAVSRETASIEPLITSEPFDENVFVPDEATTASPDEAALTPTTVPVETFESKEIDVAPTPAPTEEPTPAPTEAATPAPTEAPITPTPVPTEVPTPVPTDAPVATPVVVEQPTPEPKNYTVYQVGDKNDEIIMIQQQLIDKGLLTGNADGIFGNMTREAILQYQEAESLEKTGIADAETQKRLAGIIDPPVELAQPSETPKPVELVSLSMGEKKEITGICTIQVDKYEFASTITASNASEDTPSTFFEASNSETTYLHLTGAITNTSDQPISPHIFTFTVFTGSLQEYTGFAAFETNENRDLSAYDMLAPGESTTLVLLVEVPVGLKDSEEPVVASAVVSNTINQITLR